MMSRLISTVLVSGILLGVTAPADAAKKPPRQSVSQQDGYTIHRHRGGYSYDYADSISTYGGNRKRSGGPPTFREQTVAGPFDNSFFFDSAIGMNGGDAPYMH